VPGRENGKQRAESSESVRRSKGKRWCCYKRKSSECCEHVSNLRTTAGIQVSDGSRYAPHMEAVLVADVRPWSLLPAKWKAIEDSKDNVDEPTLREVNNSHSQCRE
jgi:hypothetical protein